MRPQGEVGGKEQHRRAGFTKEGIRKEAEEGQEREVEGGREGARPRVPEKGGWEGKVSISARHHSDPR